MIASQNKLRPRQKLGKYRIERRIAEGGFATVYEAYDTIEGIRVALKIPLPGLMTRSSLGAFRTEVRLTAKLHHPNILPLKNAGYIGDHFVVVYPLGETTLTERLTHRMATATALDYAEQLLGALAFAHSEQIIHCDVKPDNCILFADGRICLSDFGIAKVAMHTLSASGAGTLGFIAPEQAMGRPSFRSDVFSVGLVIYRMLAGVLPKWPYDWPPPGVDRVTRRVGPEMTDFLRRAIEVNQRDRFADAEQMLAAFRRLKPAIRRHRARKARPSKKDAARANGRTNGRAGGRTGGRANGRDWIKVREREFQKLHAKALETKADCPRCRGPIAESMSFCPWCANRIRIFKGEARFPAQCGRCGRGMKLDWRFCAHCYGRGYEPHSAREYSDRRYTARCANTACSRRDLMQHMRYCPWCRTKVVRKWLIPNASPRERRHRCTRCGWGVLKEFWHTCPWCGKAMGRSGR